MERARFLIYGEGFAGDHFRGFGKTEASRAASCFVRSDAGFLKNSCEAASIP